MGTRDGRYTEQATRLLQSFHGQDPARTPTDQVFEAVYDDLRRMAGFLMARQPPDHTLQATALVSEAYLKLVGRSPVDWSNQRHFVNAVVQAMRQVLVDRARTKGRDKRGGRAGRIAIDLDHVENGRADELPPELGDRCHDAVVALERHNARWGEVVRLRFFAGLTVEQTASLMDISPRLVKQDWRFGRVWLARELRNVHDGA